MASNFPSNPTEGDIYPIGEKSFMWDGNKWVLLSSKDISVRKIGQLADVEDENAPAGEGDLLSWDPNTPDDDGQPGSWVRSTKADRGDVEILDDLLDVEIKDSENKLGPELRFYIQEDPTVDNGWGRYRVVPETKRVEYHFRDIDGNGVEDLLTANPDGTIGHRVAHIDGSYSADVTLLSSPEFTGKSYIFYYREQEVVDKLFNGGVSKAFIVQSNEYRGLAHNTVLTYKVDPETGDKKWRPAFPPGTGNNANISLGSNPPADPAFEDIWVDSTNYYMYVWTPTGDPALQRGAWVAVTGPGGVDGGSHIVNDSVVSILPSRGFSVQSGGSFSLNQPKNHIIQMSPSSTVELDGAPPAPDERLVSDIWIDTKDYKMYVWNGTEWVALTGDQSTEGAGGAGFNYIPCQLDGGTADTKHCVDNGYLVDGGRAQQEYCNNDDLYSEMRPGVIAKPDMPSMPKKGDLWFDTSLMELRVWYVNEASQGRWVSATNPNMKPQLPPDPNPDPVRIDGPNSAVANLASDTFSVVLGHNLIAPFFSWATTDPDAYIQKIAGSLNNVQIVFSEPGTHSVSCTVNAQNLNEPVRDSLKVVVASALDNVPVVYDVLVRFFSGGDSNVSGNRYVLNGKRQPYLTFVRSRKYIMTQQDSSNYNYPMRFYHTPKTEWVQGRDPSTYEYKDGVIVGQDYIEIQVPSDAPPIIYYDSPETDDVIGSTIYLSGTYTDVSSLTSIFAPIVSERDYQFTIPEYAGSAPNGPGEVFFSEERNYTPDMAPSDFADWKWFFTSTEPDLNGVYPPDDLEKLMIEGATIQVTDASGAIHSYRVNDQTQHGQSTDRIFRIKYQGSNYDDSVVPYDNIMELDRILEDGTKLHLKFITPAVNSQPLE